MAATATQGSFVSRTKKIERDGSLKRIRVISGSVFEPTGSNLNTAFTVYGANYRLIAEDGGEIKTGLRSGSLYNVGLKYVSSSANPVINLFS